MSTNASGQGNGGRWARVNQIFHGALQLPPDQREAFLDSACAGNHSLRDEVSSLLRAHERADDAMGRVAGELANLVQRELGGEAVAGPQLGHYRILRVLGEGGMGIVYLAEDTRLGRTVALKALAPQFTGEPSHRERLKREARAAAMLTHPGIATVYALEEIDDRVLIAAEYVPGETLRQELSRGALGLTRAIDTGLGVARALATAHDRGVVHRDLKPDNVMRTPAGDVKILDFGLARLRDQPAGARPPTEAGTFIGTPGYMSPEQIHGDPVDGRSDVFSLGILIYELVSGVNPFAGHDDASTIARIVQNEPAPLAVASAGDASSLAVERELDAVLRTCLRKLPAERFNSVHDLVAALERVRLVATGAVAPTPSGHLVAAEVVRSARWWWQFHQATAAVAYSGLTIGMWFAGVRIGALAGRFLFIAGLVGAIVAVTLRLHLWFVVRSYPSERVTQQKQSHRWIVLADTLVTLTLAAMGVALLTSHAPMAALLIGASVGVWLSSTVIEPATTRAAFPPTD
jgi:eukaryotic-like serine/threonine-protein kinase